MLELPDTVSRQYREYVDAEFAELDVRARELIASKRKPGTIRFLRLDVTSTNLPTEVASAVEPIGPLDAVVCNAGIGAFVPWNLDYAGWDSIMKTDAWGKTMVYLGLAKAELLLPGSRIVVIGSLAGLWGSPATDAAYVAATAANAGLVKAHAKLLAEKKIVINGVFPGPVDTGPGGMVQSMDAAKRTAMIASMRTGRISTPGDVANTVLHLCTDVNVTGSILEVHGGLHIH